MLNFNPNVRSRSVRQQKTEKGDDHKPFYGARTHLIIMTMTKMMTEKQMQGRPLDLKILAVVVMVMPAFLYNSFILYQSDFDFSIRHQTIVPHTHMASEKHVPFYTIIYLSSQQRNHCPCLAISRRRRHNIPEQSAHTDSGTRHTIVMMMMMMMRKRQCTTGVCCCGSIYITISYVCVSISIFRTY